MWVRFLAPAFACTGTHACQSIPVTGNNTVFSVLHAGLCGLLNIPYRIKLWKGKNFGEFGELPQFAKFFSPIFPMKHVIVQFVS